MPSIPIPQQAPPPGLRHLKPLNGDPGAMSEGPATSHRVFALDEWATMINPKRIHWLRRNLVDEYARDPRMRWFAASVLREAGVAPRDYPNMASALLKWVQQNVYYTNEAGESIQSPWVTIDKRTGDCDDAAVLLATLAAAVDLPWKFVLLGRDAKGAQVRWVEGDRYPAKRVEFFHIYVMLGWPAGAPFSWASAEPTMKAPLGFDPALHGLQVDRQGRPHLPPEWGGPLLAPSERLSRGGKPGAQALGALTPAEETNGTREYLKALSLSVFEAAISAVAVTVALRAFDRYQKRRR